MQDLLLGVIGRYLPPFPSLSTKDLAASPAANTTENGASPSQELTRYKLFWRKKFFMNKLSLRMLGFILACLIPLFSELSANAATFYVASAGSDSNPGSSALPWATLQHAANVATVGDTVIVRAGVYAGAKFFRSGLSTAPITRFSFNEQFITLTQWQQKTQDQQSLLFSSLTALFVAPTSDDYHLKTGSVAINTGVTIPGVLDDLEGTLRPQGVNYDIGAYEKIAP
jgi:hypothetical protein